MPKTEIILYGSAGLFLLIKFIRGWHLGPLRQVVGLVAILLAWMAWRSYGGAFAETLQFTGLPQIVLIPLSSSVVAMLVYCFVKMLGALLFRKTSDRSFGFFWLASGLSGAGLGVLTGTILLFLTAILIRFFGTFAEGMASPSLMKGEGAPLAPTSTLAASAAPSPGKTDDSTRLPEPSSPASASPPSRLSVTSVGSHVTTRFLIESKTSLEKGWMGTLIYLFDPIPEETYQNAFKAGRALSTPTLLARLGEHPRIAELLRSPEFMALQGNEKLIGAIRDKRFLELLRDPDFVKALDQPEILKILKALPLGEILNEAVPENAPPTPAASPEAQLQRSF